MKQDKIIAARDSGSATKIGRIGALPSVASYSDIEGWVEAFLACTRPPSLLGRDDTAGEDEERDVLHALVRMLFELGYPVEPAMVKGVLDFCMLHPDPSNSFIDIAMEAISTPGSKYHVAEATAPLLWDDCCEVLDDEGVCLVFYSICFRLTQFL